MMIFPELHIGRSTMIGAVTMFPVWSVAPAIRGLVTGSAAEVDVSELADGPSVSALTVGNAGARPALLLEGELLGGGWQDRALVRDVILAPRSTGPVEVACVEQSRWGGAAGHRRLARRATPRVQLALRAGSEVRQARVWDDVRRYERPGGAPVTSVLSDRLEQLTPLSPLQPMPGQRGVLVGIGGQPLALELFGSSRALDAHLPAIVDAARLDAQLLGGAHSPVPGRRARRLIGHLDDLGLDRGAIDSRGGIPFAISTSRIIARGIAVADGRIAHLGLLNIRHPILEGTL